VSACMEELCRSTGTVNVMENHDILVAEAQDLREKARLISVHPGLEIIVKDHDVPLANVRGGFGGNGCDVGVPLLLLGGTDTLVLSALVAFQGFL
jgi:hypothetical protein